METLTIIYRDKSVMRYLREKVDQVSYAITYVDKLEKNIFEQLVSYYEANQKRSIKRIKYLIDREIVQALKRYSTEKIVVFSDMTSTDDFGESSFEEPEDMLARVSETVIDNISLKEKISGLASTDSERFVLNAWIEGLSDKAIAAELALHFGGKASSKRIWVQRFRTKCQRKLVA